MTLPTAKWRPLIELVCQDNPPLSPMVFEAMVLGGFAHLRSSPIKRIQRPRCLSEIGSTIVQAVAIDMVHYVAFLSRLKQLVKALATMPRSVRKLQVSVGIPNPRLCLMCEPNPLRYEFEITNVNDCPLPFCEWDQNGAVGVHDYRRARQSASMCGEKSNRLSLYMAKIVPIPPSDGGPLTTTALTKTEGSEGILGLHSMSFHRVPCLGRLPPRRGTSLSQLYQVGGTNGLA
jgi:hypothetical protein